MIVSRDILTKRLSDAEEAYHQLMTGTKAAVFVDQNGERVEYAKVDLGRLVAYITELRRQLGPCTNQGPMTVWM